MSVTSAQELFNVLRRSELLEEERLKEAGDAVQPGDDPAAAVKRWVDAGLISEWQGAQLAAGRESFYLGKYRLIGLLGRGGMGGVFLAEHTTMNRRVALKTIAREFGNTPGALEQFLLEARTIAALDHPSVCQAYSFDQEGGRFFLVMEYIEGSDLSAVVKEQGPLENNLAADYIRQVAEGLQHGHEQTIVHCDIKPSNLLLDKSGAVKIIDMGMSRLQDPAKAKEESSEERLLCSVDYVAPEQGMGKDFDHRADIYSLGCTLYFLLTARPPFPDIMLHEKLMRHQAMQPEPISTFRSDVTEELIEICQKMMAKKPEDRYQTAEEVGEALAKFPAPKKRRKAQPAASLKRAERLPEAATAGPALGTESIAGRQSGPRKTGSLKKREKIIAAVVAAGLLILLTVLISLWWTSTDVKAPGPADHDWLSLNNPSSAADSAQIPEKPDVEAENDPDPPDTPPATESIPDAAAAPAEPGEGPNAGDGQETNGPSSGAMGAILLDDDFANEDLATGGPGDTRDGFKLVTNKTGGSGKASESGSEVTVTTTGSHNNSGIVSIHTIDPTADPENGFSVRWTVARTDRAEVNGLNLTVQGKDGFFNRPEGRPNVLLKFLGGSFHLVANKGNSAELATEKVTASEVLDGFTVTAKFDAAGWSYSAEGLDSLPDNSGSWIGNHNYDTLFDSDTHVGGFIQQGNSSKSVVFDRISVISGATASPESPPSDVIADGTETTTEEPPDIPAGTAVSVTEGLLSRYSFDKDANDSVGSNHATLKGGASIADDPDHRGVLKLEAKGSWASLGEFDLTGEGYAVSCWFKTSASGQATIVSGARHGGHALLLELKDGKVRYLHRFPFGSGGGADIYSTETYNNSQWHHAVAVKNANTTILYVDGVRVAAKQNSTQFDAPIQIIAGRLAVNRGERYFPGQINDLRIYDRPLTLKEVSRVARLEPDPFEALGFHGKLQRLGKEPPASVPHQLGTLKVPPEAGMSLQLMGAANAVRPPRSLQMERNEESGQWVIWLTSPSRTGSDAQRQPMARIAMKDETLYFQWAKGLSPAQANALLNCGLKISVGDEAHLLPLAAPRIVEPLTINLDVVTKRLALPAGELPATESLRMEIRGLTGGLPKAEIPPAVLSPGTTAEIRFKDAGLPEFWLQVGFQATARSVTVDVTANVNYQWAGLHACKFKPKEAATVIGNMAAEKQRLQFQHDQTNDKRKKGDLAKKIKPLQENLAKFQKLHGLYEQLRKEPASVQFRVYSAVDAEDKILLMRSAKSDRNANP